MATELPDERRRLMLRRGRGAAGGAGSFGGGSRVESLRDTAAEADEVDDEIEPDEYARQAIARGNQVAVYPPPDPLTPDEARDSPRSRLNEVALAGSASYTKEYRLGMLHRLLMRGTPLDQIARQLQVSISTIEKDRAELKRRLREAAKDLNIDEMVGNQNAVYDEVQAMSLRLASARETPTAMKLASMRTALAANADRTRFLNTAGVFDVLRFRRAEDGSGVSDVQALMARTAEMLAGLDGPDEDEVPKKRSPIRRSKPGGFAPMTFDDADASGSSNEVQEL